MWESPGLWGPLGQQWGLGSQHRLSPSGRVHTAETHPEEVYGAFLCGRVQQRPVWRRCRDSDQETPIGAGSWCPGQNDRSKRKEHLSLDGGVVSREVGGEGEREKRREKIEREGEREREGEKRGREERKKRQEERRREREGEGWAVGGGRAAEGETSVVLWQGVHIVPHSSLPGFDASIPCVYTTALSASFLGFHMAAL